jgi:NADH-quinone oxidoreductase subunit G
MPKCTIDGQEIDVPAGTTVIQAAMKLGVEVPHFCWHPDLAIDGNCRMCMVEIEKMPRLQIACNTTVTEGMVVRTVSEKARQAHSQTLEFLLVNHPIDCPVCDQAGECYLQDQYMEHGLHDSKIQIEEKVNKRKVVDLGPIMLDAERCVLCTRCLRFEKEVSGTNSLEFKSRGNETQIGSFNDGPITHNYAGNLADVCPVGALLSHDFRFKMRVWFLESADAVCPGCSTGCNIYVDHRDGEIHRLRPRRNVEVNRSWMCDVGRREYKEVQLETRQVTARLGGADATVAAALDEVAAKVKEAGSAVAFVASPQASNEDLFLLRSLADKTGGLLDFRVGNPQDKVRQREDAVLLRKDRNPNTQGCLDLGMGRTGMDALAAACRDGKVKVLVLQGPEMLRDAALAEAAAKVPYVVVFATHQGPELARAQAVLPAAMWAETEGTFTNFQRRVQRFRPSVPPLGAATARWELAGGLLLRLGAPPDAVSAREVFGLLRKAVADYAALGYQELGAQGVALPITDPGAQEPALGKPQPAAEAVGTSA